MSDAWYYVDSERAVGPIAVSELAQILRSRPDWSCILVWSEGLPDWQTAGEVADLKKWMATPPPVPSTSRQPDATPELQKIRWRRPRNLAILGASTLYGLYIGLRYSSIIIGLLSGLFAGLVGGAIIVVIVEILASIAYLFRTKFPRTAFYVGTIAFWLGILLFVWFAGLVGYMIYEAAPIRLVFMFAGISVFYGLLGWVLRRGLAVGFRDVRKR
jgi:hypothetical protein